MLTVASTGKHILIFSCLFMPGHYVALTRVAERSRCGCLRVITLISVVALIFTGLNKGAGLHIQHSRVPFGAVASRGGRCAV